MTRASRPLALLGAAAGALTLAACGGSTVSDSVPSSVPPLTPVLSNSALDNNPDASSNSGNSSSANAGTGATGSS